MQIDQTALYSTSLRRRARVLFAPARTILLVAAIIFAVILNIAFIHNGGQPEWLGPLSVGPLFSVVGWMCIVDYNHRQREKQATDRGHGADPGDPTRL